LCSPINVDGEADQDLTVRIHVLELDLREEGEREGGREGGQGGE